MGASAFALGFFIALGGWTASKVTKQVDIIIDPPKIVQIVQIEKLEKKEKEDDSRN